MRPVSSSAWIRGGFARDFSERIAPAAEAAIWWRELPLWLFDDVGHLRRILTSRQLDAIVEAEVERSARRRLVRCGGRRWTSVTMAAAKNNGEQHNSSNVTVPFDDPTVLQRLRAGDAGAFDLVYNTYASALVRFVYSYVLSTAVAQDVVADTFAHLWDRREQVELKYGLKAYLFAAARFRARMALRSAGRVDRFLSRLAAEPEDEGADTTSLDVALDAPRLDAALRRALQALPVDRRRLVALRWYEGLTVPEIAHVLGLSVGAVEQRLLRTLRALRQILDARP